MTVYDLLSTGPKDRFNVWSDARPMIIHNCKLALGFGMGVKFTISMPGQARDKNGRPPVLEPSFAHYIVHHVYRGNLARRSS
ncbi:hypothetical protein P5X00_38685 (plasmid) [Paraburkholderia sp. A2RO-4L]|uniref:hypothetical protein n=1 Tax=Paraburkholderia sp. A2RO-4L TaxID=3028374 RepID=UPI003DA84CA7